MSYLAVILTPTEMARPSSRDGFVAPFVARALFMAVIGLAFAGGLLATDSAHTARLIAGEGGDWANLLRAMAAIKMLFAGAVSAAVLWRLDAPISATMWGGYALATAAAWAGPGLIWGLVHILLGAVFLHAGLIAMAVLIWRDPATRARLSETIARRSAKRSAS